MQHTVIEKFRRALTARRESLLSWLSGDNGTRDRCLGGCSEGDVSVIEQLDSAIKCATTGEFGQCDLCDGDVEVERLRADFTTRVCLSCYSEGELRTLERDLELAARVQQQLFPRFVPALAGVEVAAHVRPARFVGGDYYDFFPFSDHAQGAVVADVMGKGLAASMLMSNLQASIRILGPSYDDPAALLLRLNELFRYNVSMTKFISIFVVKIDPEKSCIRYASAGHNPAILWRSDRSAIAYLGPTGPAVGLVHEPVFESRVVRFSPGDAIVMYTDGVSETRDSAGEEFGLAGIERAVRENPRNSAVELVDSVRARLDAHSGNGGDAHDDTTLLVVRRDASEPEDSPAAREIAVPETMQSILDAGGAE